MRLSGVMMSAVGAAGGLAVAVVSFHAAATVPRQPVPAAYRAAAVAGRALPAPPPRVVVHTEPCHRPAKLVKGACVTTVVRTVPAAPAPVAVPPAATAPKAARATGTREHEHEDGPDNEAQEPPGTDDD